jgi:hypothetical protein
MVSSPVENTSLCTLSPFRLFSSSPLLRSCTVGPFYNPALPIFTPRQNPLVAPVGASRCRGPTYRPDPPQRKGRSRGGPVSVVVLAPAVGPPYPPASNAKKRVGRYMRNRPGEAKGGAWGRGQAIAMRNRLCGKRFAFRMCPQNGTCSVYSTRCQ